MSTLLEELTNTVEMVNKMSAFMSEADPTIPKVKAVISATGMDLDCEGQTYRVSPYDRSVPEELIKRCVMIVTEAKIRRAELQAHAAFMKGKG